MKLTFHSSGPTRHGALRMVQTLSSWSVKTRRVPSRHCRDAMVYGPTTTPMHDNEYPPPRHPPPPFLPRQYMTPTRFLLRFCDELPTLRLGALSAPKILIRYFAPSFFLLFHVYFCWYPRYYLSRWLYSSFCAVIKIMEEQYRGQ